MHFLYLELSIVYDFDLPLHENEWVLNKPNEPCLLQAKIIINLKYKDVFLPIR